MERVLITGGAGFIGSHLTDKLIEEGFRVRILDNLQKPVHLKGMPEYINKKAEFILGDVRNKKDLENALKDVEYIFHLAAYQDYLPDFSTFMHTNTVSTALIYEIIVEKELKIKKFIVASSQFVQGEGIYTDISGKLYYPDLRPVTDLSAGQWDFRGDDNEILKCIRAGEEYHNPPNAYAISKYSQEIMAMKFGRRYEIPSVAMRFSIVQGARQSFYNAYSGACRIFSLSYYFKKAPVIFEDGEQKRDFVNIHDVIEALYLVMESKNSDYKVYNVSGDYAYTIKEFDRIVAREFGCEELEPNVPGEFRFGDTRNALSDNKKLKALGWSPKYNAEDSVREYRDYLISHKDIDDILEYAEKKMKMMNVVRRIK